MEPFRVGDEVRRRGSAVRGTVWSVTPGMVVVRWDDPDENAYVRNPRQLVRAVERLRPRQGPQAPE